MIYAVIDTNVIVSAMITHNALSATVAVMERLLAGDIVPVYDDEILNEYSEVLHRRKFNLSHNDILALIEYIRAFGISANRMKYDGKMPDEKDRPFYEVSLSVTDSFLVTGNLKHFPLTPRVVSPSELIEVMSRIEQ